MGRGSYGVVTSGLAHSFLSLSSRRRMGTKIAGDRSPERLRLCGKDEDAARSTKRPVHDGVSTEKRDGRNQGALTNDRIRFPYTYIGMLISQHAAWQPP